MPPELFEDFNLGLDAILVIAFGYVIGFGCTKLELVKESSHAQLVTWLGAVASALILFALGATIASFKDLVLLTVGFLMVWLVVGLMLAVGFGMGAAKARTKGSDKSRRS